MSFAKSLFVVCLATSGAVACGSDSQSSSTAADSTNASGSSTASVAAPDGHQAAQASHESADTAGSSDDVTSQQSGMSSHLVTRGATAAEGHLIDAQTLMQYTEVKPHSAHSQVSAAEHITTTYDMFGCTAVFDGNFTQTASGYSLDANLNYDATACTRSRKVSGTASLAAVYNANQRSISVTENMNQTLANGDVVRISSENVGAATYTLTSSGYANAGDVVSKVLVNEHRVRTTAQGNVVFDFSINTDPNSLLTITNGFVADANAAVTQRVAQTRTIVSGVNTVVHNIAGYTAKHTFANLSRLTKSCSCPTSGSLTEDVTYTGAKSTNYSRVYTFTGCGEASVNVTASTDPNIVVGTTQVTWDSCK